MMRHRKVNLAWKLVLTQKPTTAQEAQSPLVAQKGCMFIEWIQNDIVRLFWHLATVTERHRMFLTLNWWNRTQRARPFSGRATASTRITWTLTRSCNSQVLWAMNTQEAKHFYKYWVSQWLHVQSFEKLLFFCSIILQPQQQSMYECLF